MTEPAQPRRRRWAKRAGAAAFGIVLALVAGEISVRVLGVTAEPKRHFYPGIFAEDSELGWALQANYDGAYRNFTEHTQTTTNARGFRGGAWEPKRDGELRVVALGDSCTFGMGVTDSEAYPAQLEQLLREGGRDATVLNLGVMGYDTHQEAGLFERLAPELAPQVVILAWLPNDATNPETRPQAFVREGWLVKDEEEFQRWRDRSERRGVHASVLYRVLRVRSKQLRSALGRQVRGKWNPDWMDEAALAHSMAGIDRIHARCAELGARLIVVFLPRREEVEQEQSLDHYDLVRAHVEKLGGTVVSIPHAWREQRPEGELYIFRDKTHFTGVGYADIAERLAKAIGE